MASLEKKEYSPGLQYYINNPSFGILLSNVEQEVTGFLEDRPIVVLKNDKATVCYRRPGIEKDIQAAFVQRKLAVDTPAKPLLDKAVMDLSDLANPPLCSKHPEDLAHLFYICEKANLLKELFLEITKNDTDYFQQLPQKRTPAVTLSPIGLEECACINHQNNRVFTEARYLVEQQFVQHISQLIPDKTQIVKVLSLASGMLLQDWKFIGLLVEQGYTQFEWTLVDPINAKNAPIDKLKDFFAKIADIHVTLSAYTAMSDVPKTFFHAIVVVDADASIYGDLVKSLPLLVSGGKTFYSGGHNLFEIDQSGVTVIQKPRSCEFISQDIAKAIPDGYNGPISLVIGQYVPIGIYALAAFAKQGIDAIRLVTDITKKQESSLLFTTLFPSIKFQIEETSTQELVRRVKEKEHFDFIICPSLTPLMEKSINRDTFQQVSTHTITKTTTCYLISQTGVNIFRFTTSP